MSVNLNQRYESESHQCDVHGAYTAFRVGDRWTPCEKCTQAATASARDKQRAQDRRDAVIAKLQQSGIPEIAKGAKLSGQPEQWMNRCITHDTRGPLVLVGPKGTGKTWQSSAALRRWIVRTETGGLYVTAADYAMFIRSTWNNRSGESERDVLLRYARAPFLVLDDLGAGRDQDMPIVQGLIDSRYRDGLMGRCIVVSNVSADNFESTFGERAADRIRHNSVLIEMIGESMRHPE